MNKMASMPSRSHGPVQRRWAHRSLHCIIMCAVTGMPVSVREAQGDSARKDFPKKVTSLLGLKDQTESRPARRSTSKMEKAQTNAWRWLSAWLSRDELVTLDEKEA